MFTTKLMPLPPSEEQVLWFSLIEYDPDYAVLKKMQQQKKNQTTTGLLRAL
jgi:hypothetical protein